MNRESLRLITLISAMVTVAALALPVSAAGEVSAPPKPSWKCIGGVCLGQSRASVVYRHGGIVDDTPSRTIRVPGGKVTACFWRCQGAVTEDGFTYYGGTQRPSNRLLTLATCTPTFLLPDGVKLGTKIPFGKRWNGYHQISLFEPGPRPGWEKFVRVGTMKVRVVLDMNQGRVYCAYLEGR